MTAKDAPVLVVGGRTTGLMMAAELARHGMPVRIIDKSPGIDPHSRATYLRARTLEILHGLGLADQIVARGQPLKAISIYANGKHVATSPDLPVDSPFPWGAAFAQCKTERILQRHLNRLGVQVQRSTELLTFTQSTDRVQATIKTPDGPEETVTTPWLVGCDGAHSITRRLIDETFPGQTDPMAYLLADVLIDGPLKPEVAYVCLHDDGDFFIFLLDEGRRQVIATLPKNSTRREPPTLAELQQLLDQRGFTHLRLRDPRWLTLYHTNYRLAPHYRHGRVFLAGDAAHIHSVVGGQGMNTGLQDAHNLAWKLALVIRGVAPAWWLDSYEIERRRIAADVIAWTKRATEQFTLFAELSPDQRARVLEHMALPEHDRLKLRAHEEEIDLDYRTCRLCFEPDDDLAAGPHPGARAPDAAPLRIAGQSRTLIEALRSPHHHLLLFSSAEAGAFEPELIAAARHALAAHGHWLKVLVVGSPDREPPLSAGAALLEDPQGALRQRYAGDVARLYLIRPDGYVSYRSRRIDSLDDYVRRVMG